MTPEDRKSLLVDFNGNPPATPASLRLFEMTAGLALPQDYVDFLRYENGGEGFIGSAYLILWRVEELLELNRAYQVTDYAPGLLLFGSDGGGEAFAFDRRSDIAPVVLVPFVGMDLKLIRPLASTFTAFLEAMPRLSI
ncbi:hypothetical protein FRZ44_36480 [Hypericibacter terrae]|uniref:Knr4/Smi1-like domain-containing protein n=2 Tax=Hypericibacter terrae TaxID=2602015 RepID=A0A5J6MLV7_9PROT|nr:hypothetical protein FRZ44_36480 [Hypericibacter terrae]